MAKLMKARESDQPRSRIYVTLDPNAVEVARKIGNGVASRGIDRALFYFDAQHNKKGKKHAKQT